MTKFFLSGPIQFLPNDSAAFNGLLSTPFLSLFLINTMFGFRIVCIESAFFTSYRLQSYNFTKNSIDSTQIIPIIPPEYRLLVYLAPGTVPFVINSIKLLCTTKESRKYFMTYPQFIISPCFTPFLFEVYETTNQRARNNLKIWRLGTVINAIYIGCIPQCILCLTDYYKGVYDWRFNDGTLASGVYENNDALFKSNYGNTIFAATTAALFLILIILFFGSETLFKVRGIYCRCLNILFCPCPEPCINLTESDLDPSSSFTNSAMTTARENVGDDASEEKPVVDLSKPETDRYLYNCCGETKIRLYGYSSEKENHSKSQVTDKIRFWEKIQSSNT